VRALQLRKIPAHSDASRRWFLLSQNQSSISCLRLVEPSHKIELVFSASLETVVGASGVETPSLNRPSAGPGSLHAV